MGSAGAAVATVIARFVEAGVVILWTHFNKEKQPFIRGAYRSLSMPKERFIAIGQKCIPLLINEVMWAGGMAFLA